MEVFAGMDPRLPLGAVADHARRVETLGYDGLHVPETVHDGLAVAQLAVTATERITVRTAVTVAFARSPLLTAYAAWDLAALSGGRFELGLGTQIRQNIEERYGMPWADPVARMRDYVAVVATAFDAFATGRLQPYEGEHYRLTRLQAYFTPDPAGPRPPVWLGGVNAGICRLAGQVADGFVTHPTNSVPRYLESRCLPWLREGRASAGRGDPVPVVAGTSVITGADDAAVARERERQRRLFAFLYSTPAYRTTLDLYGWGDLGDELRERVRADRWDGLGSVVTDEVLETIVPCGTYAELPQVLAARYRGLADGVVLMPPAEGGDDAEFRALVAALQSV